MALRLGAHPLAVSVPASQSATPRHCQEAKSVARVTVVASASAKQPEDLAKPVSRRHVFIGAGALAATTSPFFAGARYALAEEESAEEPALVDEAVEEAIAEPEAQPEPEQEATPELEAEAEADPEAEPEAVAEAEAEAVAEPETVAEVEAEAVAEPETEAEAEAEAEPETETEGEVEKEGEVEVFGDDDSDSDSDSEYGELEETPVLKAMAELSGFLQELKKLTELP
ncbi:unnamed protein product [Closterium sp. NIES-53]